MKAAFAVAWTTLVLYLRETTTIALTALLTALMMVVFGTVGANPEMRLNVATWNQAGASGQELLRKLAARERVTVKEVGSLEAIRAAMRANDAVAGIVIGSSFTASGGLGGVKMVVADKPSDWTRVSLDMLTQALHDVVAPREPMAQIHIGARKDRYIDFIFPGVLAMSIMQASFPVGLFLLDTRRRGVLRRFRLAPRSVVPFLSGLVASRLLISALNLALLSVIAVAVFKVQIAGSWLDLSVAVLLGSSVFISLGILIATVAPTTESGAILVQLSSLTMSFLCGVFYRMEQIPEVVRWLPTILPLTYVADALRGIANAGTSLSAHPTALAVLAFWLMVPLLVSGMRFRRFLEGE